MARKTNSELRCSPCPRKLAVHRGGEGSALFEEWSRNMDPNKACWRTPGACQAGEQNRQSVHVMRTLVMSLVFVAATQNGSQRPEVGGWIQNAPDTTPGSVESTLQVMRTTI